MLMNIRMPKFDICQSIVAPNCFTSHANSCCSDFFQKKICLTSDLKFTFFRHNIVSNEQSVWALKKLYSGLIIKLQVIPQIKLGYPINVRGQTERFLII